VKNTLFRRAAVGTIAAAAAVGLSTFFAAPASAHTAGPAGVAKCGVDGKYTVTWTVTNDFDKPVKLTNVKITPGGGTHADISLPALGHDSFTTTYAGTTKAALVLSVDGLWQDGPNTTWPSDGHPRTFASDEVKLDGTCKPTETTPSPSVSPSPSKSPKPEASVSVTPSTPSLPVTGSSNTMPMVGTGAALVAGGAALVVTLRRRRRVTFTAE
jgi:LPXTG-motif cell wall-anchored protein